MTVKIKHVQALLGGMGGEQLEFQGRYIRPQGMAELAFCAEQYGYTLLGVETRGFRFPVNVLTFHRDPSPAAQARAAATMQQYPGAGQPGQPVPGLEPAGGAKLRGPAAAARELAVLKDRINYDLTGKQATQRVLRVGAWLAVLLVLRFFAYGAGTSALVMVLVVAALYAVALGVALVVNKARNTGCGERLQAAGYQKVEGAQGHKWLPPHAVAAPQQAYPPAQQGYPQQQAAPAPAPVYPQQQAAPAPVYPQQQAAPGQPQPQQPADPRAGWGNPYQQ
ncbi:hypothetical protein BIV57_07000 [Mangrovactinospora gilvigrisea]|uniref:Uncharacterized protein n=1 Tax=Mangrovactinospora gilvigrisea TaxID=1428644 RepID=A0A1J7CES3_9ACTN|nr:hypothetical protein [Mangrovactinospora gilvigrisea]OIV38186.1 hypothetical protein BIV57_07000 [Mangrovactinospora gilvigrisea]